MLQIGIETIPILSATEILSHTPATAILMWIKVGQGNLAVHFRLAPRCLSWVKTGPDDLGTRLPLCPPGADIPNTANDCFAPEAALRRRRP